MKTFKEFLAQSYAHLEEAAEAKPGSKKELQARMAAAAKRNKRRSLDDFAYLGAVRAGKKGSDIERRADKLGKSPKDKSIEKREKIIKDLKSSYPENDYNKANRKHRKLNASGLHGHHITPLHYSGALKAKMSPEEWKERVRKDTESGIYHGHHHKNLMGAVTDNTPESRAKTGIRHQKGGAHELESKTKDLYSTSIPHKDVLTAAHRVERRKQAEERKKEKG
jgi:hypothetical protein